MTIQQRFDRLLDYIDAHLSEDLNLDKLSQYHFHRQFSAFFGISVFKYIQLVRCH